MPLVAQLLASTIFFMSTVPAAASCTPVTALVRECAPFIEELTLALGPHVEGPQVEEPSDFVLRGRQALIFGAKRKSSIVKFVGREHTAAKPEALQRPFVESCRREVEFFRSLTGKPVDGDGDGNGNRPAALAELFPRVSATLATPVSSDCRDEAFALVMEDLYVAGYAQPPSLSEATAASALEALSALHAHFWADPAVLGGDRGSFWALERRPQEELDAVAAQERWAGVVSAFAAECRDLPLTLGRDLALAARELDAVVSSTAVTMIHGDAKPANLFSKTDGLVKLIDMQWCGKGNPFSDVAYLLCTSLDASLLKSGITTATEQEDDADAELVFARLIAHYERSLIARLNLKSEAARLEFSRRLHASLDVCFLDYVRIVVLSLWKTASPASMQANSLKQGFSMVNRSARHLEWISRRAARCLARLRPLPSHLLAPPHKTLFLIRHAEAAHNRCFADATAAAADERAAPPEASHRHNELKAVWPYPRTKVLVLISKWY